MPEKEAQEWSAVVLAGGRGTRMGGTDKLQVLIGGRSLLAHVVDGLPTVVPVVVVGPEQAAPRPAGPVFAATTKNDKTMYVFLTAAILLGLLTTLVGSGIVGEGYNYRETVSPWFRSIFLLQPQPELMAESLPSFQVHAVAGMLVFLLWPFTRLVHAFSAPFSYLFRPYVVYRSRGSHDPGNRAPRRGWEKVGN